MTISEDFFGRMLARTGEARRILARPLTYCEKVLFSHLSSMDALEENPKRGQAYMNFSPDRVAMQDATAQMALLQFLNAGKDSAAVPASVHCDHLITAKDGQEKDLPAAVETNKEIYSFLKDVSLKYGIDFWAPGEGIIHQVVLENYAFPGGMMIGTDSHTPNAGGLGMAAIGVGGADAVDVLTGQDWELRLPRITGVELTGKLSGWASPKDVVLTLLEMLSVKGGTDRVFEYFGEGVPSISATGRATICNMGAELGATFSIFPYDCRTGEYLRKTGRTDIAGICDSVSGELKADDEVLKDPEAFYDNVIRLDLGSIEPHLNGPFTPDAGHGISSMKVFLRESGIPSKVSAALIGSCTNSSYEDLSRAASVLRQAIEKGIRVKTPLLVNPGSEQVLKVAREEGLMDIFEKAGAKVMTCACGACIGQWARYSDASEMAPNTIVTSFNRNFRSRADGNPSTYAFVCSPETVAAIAVAGRLDFNPETDPVEDGAGNEVRLSPPLGDVFPKGNITEGPGKGNPVDLNGRDSIKIDIAPDSQRLQLLDPFPAWDGGNLTGMRLLMKVKGKCTTDHISPAGKWLRFRGHLQNISANLLSGATNAFTGNAGETLNPLTGEYGSVSATASFFKSQGISSVIVAEDNYGEGSSREHAAMEPRYLGVKAVIAKGFARIHETNLKKQGILALKFRDGGDYDKVREDDIISITGLDTFSPSSSLNAVLLHSDGSSEQVPVLHTFNGLQICWFKAGSALNYLKNKNTG
ncbi:MAG: aconitate hydratase [Bacteroidales bacterium]|nr:aconitate hydratase [Bacteroidales bacterium]